MRSFKGPCMCDGSSVDAISYTNTCLFNIDKTLHTQNMFYSAIAQCKHVVASRRWEAPPGDPCVRPGGGGRKTGRLWLTNGLSVPWPPRMKNTAHGALSIHHSNVAMYFPVGLLRETRTLPPGTCLFPGGILRRIVGDQNVFKTRSLSSLLTSDHAPRLQG